jgi:hypothetical protein
MKTIKSSKKSSKKLPSRPLKVFGSETPAFSLGGRDYAASGELIDALAELVAAELMKSSLVKHLNEEIGSGEAEKSKSKKANADKSKSKWIPGSDEGAA